MAGAGATAGVEVLAARGVPFELVREWREASTGWFGPGRRDVPGAEGRGHLALVETPLGTAVAKRELPSGWKRALVRAGGRGLRSVRAFHAARDLLVRGLPTAEPLACIARRSSGAVEGILLTRYVEGRDPWSFLCAQEAPQQSVLEVLALELARLHGAGYRHRDLKAPNILLRHGTGGTIDLAWLDLDGLARPEPVTAAVRRRDLARLCASFETAEARAAGIRADAWPRLLARYYELARRTEPGPSSSAGRPERAEGRALGATRRWARRHVERNLARGRPVS